MRSLSTETPLSLIQTDSSTFPTVQSAQAIPSQDPLNSAYPVPWGTIWQKQTQATQYGKILTFRYRSPVLTSPDGQQLAHSEMNAQLNPELTQSSISSRLVITNAKGDVLKSIPSTMHLGNGSIKETTAQPIGTLSILMPATWSKDGQQLLARQFEAVLGSDVSSDYALVWNRKTQMVTTVTPTPQNYDTAILLGWSAQNPEEILFRTAILGEQKTELVAVGRDGTTIATNSDQVFPVGTRMRSDSEARR